jgi:uncharacterized membrane protein
MNNKKHMLIGTIICASTMLLFLFFYKQLPTEVPLQITMDGSKGNALPKTLFVFGFPIIFVIVNLIKTISLVKNENISVYQFYLIPGIAIIISVLTLLLALK